jgi:hypothetical protein
MQGCDTNVFFFQFSHVGAKMLITQKKVYPNLGRRQIKKEKI